MSVRTWVFGLALHLPHFEQPLEALRTGMPIRIGPVKDCASSHG